MKNKKKFFNKIIFRSALLIAILCAIILSLTTFFSSKTYSDIISPVEYATFNTWDGITISTELTGEGTLEDPFLISTGADLMYFKSLIETDATYTSLYYKLEHNIDMDDHPIDPIGSPETEYVFSGNFDGNGYSIANLTITGDLVENNYYAGLFSSASDAIIKNLNLKNVSISSDVDTYTNIYMGTLAGMITTSEEGDSLIQNIGVYNSTIEGVDSANIGGLIGYQSGNSLINSVYLLVNLTSSANVGVAVGKSDTLLDESIKNCIIYTGNVPTLYGTSVNYQTYTDIYFYSETNEYNTVVRYTYDENAGEYNYIYVDMTILELANVLTAGIDEEFSWYAYNVYLRFDNDSNIETIMEALDSTEEPNAPLIIQPHSTGVDENIAYVNDFVSDWDYYKGLNYTSNSGYLPTLQNKALYSSENLVNVQITYNANDSHNGYNAYISKTERQDTLVYYKKLVVNDNNTTTNSDDYVLIELIDNPFTDRPYGMGFNNWVTNYEDAIISYDYDDYTRYVKVPCSIDSTGSYSDVIIDMYASWTYAKTTNINSSISWTNAFNELDSTGMHQLALSTLYVYKPIDMSGYFIQISLNRGESRVGYYNTNGNIFTSGTCTSWFGCNYYQILENAYFVEGTTYYYFSNRTARVLDTSTLVPELLETILDKIGNGNMSGFYRRVAIPRGSSFAGYYDSSGIKQTSGTCGNNSCTYYELIQYYKSNGEEELYDSNTTYYYLTTRDTNIVVLNGNVATTWSSSTKPFTLTSLYGNNDYRNGATWYISDVTVNVYADTTIENIKINSEYSRTTSEFLPSSSGSYGYIVGRWNNLKMGRGIVQSGNYVNARAVMGGYSSEVGSSNNIYKYKFILESGEYNSVSLTGGQLGNSYDEYIEMRGIYGSDFDRATNNNSFLDIVFCASGSYGGNYYASSSVGVSIDLTVKSGLFGSAQIDYTSGIYVGGRTGGTFYSARRATIEGGNIYNLIGGPLTSSGRSNYNDTYIYMKGGSVGTIIGGAGNTATYGNRILQITDGLVRHSVFGGSNGMDGSGDDGTLNGSSYIYVGGNSIIGEETAVNQNTITWGAESGSVFGIGNGRVGQNYTSIGSNDNSNIVVADNAIIRRNVYGGGNYGATGISSSSPTTESNIVIVGGKVKGSVYGGGNNNGSGSSSISSTININMYEGIIEGNIYGGSNQLGTIYGNVNLSVLGGKVKGSVYGGGQGGHVNDNSVGTFVSGDINLVVGNRSYIKYPTVENNVYGGSAYGTVNGTTGNTNISSATTNVTINNGKILGSVFGGGQGNATVIPYVKGNVNVNIYGGTINSTYGGNDTSGTPNGTVTVNIRGGNITNTFGGGKNTSVTETNVNLFGGKSTNIYGGSDSNGVVDTSNVHLMGGTASNVYGGNNAGGTTGIVNLYAENVTLNNIYGGGNSADVTGNTILDISNSTIRQNIYGGGNSADVLGNVSMTINSSHIINNIFTGGNSGDVLGNTGLIVNDTNADKSIYGGGNSAGVLGNTNVLIAGDTVVGESVFGGGNSGTVGTTGVATSVTNTNIISGTINGNIYGGCNTSVVYGSANVYIGSSAIGVLGLNRGPIIIEGTVFGGGEANAAGSESYDYRFISVTSGILVDIDGTDYPNNNLVLKGSVFGSGNASSSNGDSYIYIDNIGTTALPNKAVSIQRATYVSISGSVIELTGATDRTNNFSNIKYSFNRILELKIKNNTTLLLRQNANLLESLHSLVDINGVETKATVSIDEFGNTTRNTNNRIYLLANKALNVTTNETASAYGEITGMTFFGMYTAYNNGSHAYGIYNMENNDSSDAADIIMGGSYIVGLQYVTHDITVDGFYTNYISEDYSHVNAGYVVPNIPGASYYTWSIGLEAVNIEPFELLASKYSSLGTYELSLRSFATGNTTFEIVGFNSEGLTNGITLVDSNDVPKIGATLEESNSILGLSLKTETTEWTSHGTTKFLSTDSGSYTGSNSYTTDNQMGAPTFTFYLYHAKNISLDADLGTVVITMQAKTPRNEIEYDMTLLTITIQLTAMTDTEEDAYDASITYGKKYEMPASTDVNITNTSEFTAYYSLYVNAENLSDVYGNNNDYYHTLSSDYALPVGTKITMIDLGADSEDPKYYYYIVNTNNYNAKTTQLNNDGEATYNLSDFIAMDSTSVGNTYSDSVNNQLYFHDDIDLVIEEFLFIFDFEDANITGDHLNNSIIFELRTIEDRTSIYVLGVRQVLMKYSLYETTNVVLDPTITTDSNYIYHGIEKNINYDIEVGYDETTNRQPIIDTNYESNAMGINMSFYDTSNNIVSSSLLVGTTIKIGNNVYFPSSDGVFRIKLANKVSNLNRILVLTPGSSLPIGAYRVKVDLFSSQDGLHPGAIIDNTTNFNFTLVGSNNSISANLTNGSKVIDGSTGINLAQENRITANITYDSVLENPNIRVTAYIKNKTSYTDTTYTEVDLHDVTTSTLKYPGSYGFVAASSNEYLITMNPVTNNLFNLNLETSLQSGTYKLIFKLYDGNQLIEEDIKYVLIRKEV